MKNTLDLRIPHQLGKAAARQRIDAGFSGSLRDSMAGNVVDVEQHWEGDTLQLVARGMGQIVTGTLVVEEDAVEVHLRLPWLLARLADVIRPAVQKETRRLLE